MARIEADIFISGAGIAGQIAAAVLAGQGFEVVVADPAPPPEDVSATCGQPPSCARPRRCSKRPGCGPFWPRTRILWTRWRSSTRPAGPR